MDTYVFMCCSFKNSKPPGSKVLEGQKAVLRLMRQGASLKMQRDKNLKVNKFLKIIQIIINFIK